MISDVSLEIQREPFARPFGFKGASYREKWNAVTQLRGASGHTAYGLGGLATLWADDRVFASHTETGGNIAALMALEFALQRVRGREFRDPSAMLDAIFPETHAFAKRVTRVPDLRPTFTLVSLVSLDNAAWMLHARDEGIESFDGLILPVCSRSLSGRQRRLAAVPLVTYHVPPAEVRGILDDGAFFLKVKIGQPGTEAEMLRRDMQRIEEVHRVASGRETDMTDSGTVLYYLDANGRYRSKDAVLRLLDHAERIGMLESVAVLEEPFPEDMDFDARDIPARVAADESVHSLRCLERRIEAGYGAVALKPAGKTLSMAFRMAAACAKARVPCYVADNTCVPILVDWNKNVAARLPDFPGLKCGALESNGPSSYARWDEMLDQHPCAGASWLRPRQGAFALDEDFYAQSGGIFEDPAPYAALFGPS